MSEITHDRPDDSIRDEERAEYVMSLVDQSAQAREPLEERWQESLANYFVSPRDEIQWRGHTGYPLRIGETTRSRLGYAALKDPESHQVTESLISGIWVQNFAESDFIQARNRGREDAFGAATVSDLIEYDLGLPGHARTTYEWLKDGAIFGTGIIEGYWHYEEGPQRFRQLSPDPLTGAMRSSEYVMVVPVYDDPRLRNVNILDFYPDPGEPRLIWMRKCAKRFTMSAKEAMRRVKTQGWNRDAVLKAIENHSAKDQRENEERTFERYLKLTDDARPTFQDQPMVGYEQWGEVPWKTGDEFSWQVNTVLAGELVKSKKWPLKTTRLPFFDMTFNPVEGRFHGLSPLEVIRHDQDFADVLKSMIANAVVRGTMSIPVANESALVSVAKLRAWNPDNPIIVRNSPAESVAYLNYRPPIEGAINMYGQVKQQMRESSAQLDYNQGLPMGSKRLSATEFQGTSQRAQTRPEAVSVLIDKETLPPLGRFLLDLNKQFLETDEDLALRVGREPQAVPLATILSEYDIEFVGSRRQHSRESKAASLERFVATVGNIPPVAALVPWLEILTEYTKALDLPTVEALIGNQTSVLQNILLQQLLGANAQHNNGAPAGASPAGLNPAQTGGRTLVQ